VLKFVGKVNLRRIVNPPDPEGTLTTCPRKQQALSNPENV